MRKSLLKLLGFAVVLTLSTHVSAMGMGGINVTSALGQPLKADIKLSIANKSEKTSLVARIASPDVYKGAGLEYPFGNKFKFEIESRADGEAYIRVSSAQPINDPFVSLLVELSWSSGKLLREYTFLLDPPGYVPEQPVQAEVKTLAPVAAEPVAKVERQQEQVKEVIRQEPKPAQTPAPKEEMKPSASPAPASKPKPATDIAAGSVTVNRGDTLNKIAAQNKPEDVSLERMLVALYRANIDQFDGKNMNRIKTGKILRLPDQNELTGVAQSDAVKEIRAQVADWNAYRQKLAGAAVTSKQQQEAKQVATGKISSSVADKAPVAKESAKEVLKLSKGEAPGDKAAGSGSKQVTAQDKKNAAQEEAIARNKALKEEQTRLALLEKNLQDMKRLAELKSEAAKLAKPAKAVTAPASAVAAASVVAAASEVKSAPLDAASAVKPAPVAKPKTKAEPAPEPSLVDEILGEPLYLAGGAAVLLGLAGLGFMLSRRNKTPAVAAANEAVEKDVDLGEATTGHLATPVAPSPDTGDFTGMTEAVTEEAVLSGDVDPISEADLFLNFGRDAQAEEILKEALQKMPGNHQIHLKLLGIYANRKDTASFAAIAQQLKGSGDDESWHQAAAMGRKLDPDNPLYGAAGMVEDADSATMQVATLGSLPDFAMNEAAPAPQLPDVDFDLGTLPEEQAQKDDFLVDLSKTMAFSQAPQEPVMDFDVTATSPSSAMPDAGMDFDITGTGSSSDMPDGGMDFDVTATSPSPAMEMDFDISLPDSKASAAEKEAEISLSDLDDLIFDVTSTHPPVQAAQPGVEMPLAASKDEDAGMEFTLDFPIGDVEEKPAPQPVEINLEGINLNLDEEVVTPGEQLPEIKDEHWHEVATKLDLAKAYQEMGDATGAREILEEVLREGDAEQQAAAQGILDQLG